VEAIGNEIDIRDVERPFDNAEIEDDAKDRTEREQPVEKAITGNVGGSW
jgi:hypothetical protein